MPPGARRCYSNRSGSGSRPLWALATSWRSKARLTRRIKVIGWEHVQAEQDAGRPLILVVPHTWAVDMIGRYFSMMGINMCTMMKSPKDQVFDWYINRERAKQGWQGV